MSRVLRESQRDFIQVERSGDETIFRNPRTLKEIRMPTKDVSPAVRLKLRQELQEVSDNPFAKMPAIKGLDLMARGGKELPQELDKEPYVNCGGDSALRRKQLALHDAWLARQEAKAARARQLEDENRLAKKIGALLAKAEPEPEPPPVLTSDAEWQDRMAATKELGRVRGNALSTPEQVAAAQRAADAAWGIIAQPAEGGSNDS